MNPNNPPILPVELSARQEAAHLTVAATYKDPATGALYVHEDLRMVQTPWAEEEHISPMKMTATFGDVESFVSYVQRYGTPSGTLLAWNAQGLTAVLDYAEAPENPGRCQWRATCPFRGSVQWEAWRSFANGKPVAQRAAVEQLEDLAPDIVEPSPTELTALLRSLRATVNAKADAELRPDGTSAISFQQDKSVKAAGLDLPSSFVIGIPVLKGHLDAEGRPVVYRLEVRLRVSVGDDARLALRFSIPQSERVLEAVYADRVNYAKTLLGDSYQLLRASD